MPHKAATPADASRRRIIRSSFVATADSQRLTAGVGFSLGPGGWIVQAKATVRALSPEEVTVQLRITADIDGDANSLIDPAKATADNLGYETVVATLGFQAATSALVLVDLTQEGPGRPDVTGITITGIRQDPLTVLSL